MNMEVSIDESFRKAITLHIIRNTMYSTEDKALLLGIHGPAGEGKTFQCEKVLSNMGVKVFSLSSSCFENEKSGEPASLIRRTYLSAGLSMANKECKAACILINDIDAAIGSWGELVQYTVNRQIVIGELMQLADYPELIDRVSTKRVPIIFTGNDLSKLYAPLIRAGRMTAFAWQPNLEIKTQIIKSIFNWISEDDCKEMISELSNKNQNKAVTANYLPIAFFKQLKSTIIDDLMWEKIKNTSGKILLNFTPSTQHEFKYDIPFREIMKKGEALAKEYDFTNHL